jgi:hypothetical protein
MSRAYLAWGDDHDAADAGDAAAGFDFGDDARMAAELPPTHNREPYDTLLYCPTSCPYR